MIRDMPFGQVAGPLLTTKLHVPPRRAEIVPRPRLTDRLTTQSRLILVAAPAGFGNTSILTEWLASLTSDARVAWVSLDERDNDAGPFWNYVMTAVDRAVGHQHQGAHVTRARDPRPPGLGHRLPGRRLLDAAVGHAMSLLDSYVQGFAQQEARCRSTLRATSAPRPRASSPSRSRWPGCSRTSPDMAETLILKPGYAYGNEFAFGLDWCSTASRRPARHRRCSWGCRAPSRDARA